jgi:putative ABC transport system permease protein
MNWLKHLFSRSRHYNELSESIREHLDEKIADLMDGGMKRNKPPAVSSALSHG